MKAIFGPVTSIKHIPSRQVTRIEIEVPDSFHIPCTEMVFAKNVLVTLSDLKMPYGVVNGEAPPTEQAVSEPEGYGHYAAALFKQGWFFAPRVLGAIGTDTEYREWIQRQKCLVCGYQDWVDLIGEGRCEAAHVKRPSNAGLGMKPDYSCVCLCHKHHQMQHTRGLHEGWLCTPEQARENLDKARDKLLVDWAHETLKKHIGYLSLANVPPEVLRAWAKSKDIEDTLPAIYREQGADHAHTAEGLRRGE